MKSMQVAAGLAMLLIGGARPVLAESGVVIGSLTCQVASGWGLVLGSYKDLNCDYQSPAGVINHYTGKIGKAGVDLGYHDSTIIGWLVLAPTRNVGPGDLAGTYVGATGAATVGVGMGANALFGGGGSIALQPLSLQAETGLNVAAGVEMVTLQLVPPPPPPAAAIPALPPPQRDFTVYFDTNSSTLSPAARAVVQQAVAAARQVSVTHIAVTGHTDTVGKTPYNLRLSQRRAAAVRAELLARGVPANRIDASGVGESGLAVPTAQGVNEPRNRRVVITESGPGA